MEFLLIAFIVLFVVFYRINQGESIYKFVTYQVGEIYEKYAPYSFKIVREKVKDLGLEYSSKQYTIQVAIFAGGASVISYLYFYSIVTSIIYALVAISVIPYLTFLRCKRIYSEFIFEQIQVYTTNTIMEYMTTESFVKALEGVYSSGVLEEPVLSDVKMMIDLSYEHGDISPAIDYMNSKYDYQITRNMHQMFLQITREGAKDVGGALENMLLDIDMLVEGVYRDRMDRATFHRAFLQYGLMLYLLIMLVQYVMGIETYLKILDEAIVVILLHGVVIFNSYFILSGEKYYNENVGAE
ncbi:MAG: hypothetical protein PHS45_01940 [Bacilli bacterium]|nr:hypothetical protein [Bacilli bacterium]